MKVSIRYLQGYTAITKTLSGIILNTRCPTRRSDGSTIQFEYNKVNVITVGSVTAVYSGLISKEVVMEDKQSNVQEDCVIL